MTHSAGHYTVIRYIPDIVREEFINVGVILACPTLGYQGIRTTTLGQHRLARCFDTDGHFVRHMLSSLRKAIEGRRLQEMLGPDLVPNNMLTRDSLEILRGMHHNNITMSPLRTASVENPDATLEMLFARYVAAVPRQPTVEKETRSVVKRRVEKTFREQNLFSLGLEESYRLPTLTEPTVDFAYQNGALHCYQVLSLSADEDKAKRDVNAYRQTAHDGRETLREQEVVFAALVARDESRLSERLVEVLEHDGIEPIDYRDTDALVGKIRRDLAPGLDAYTS